MNHIELFAGCGGLSLGLDRAGFELTFANELSPMAAETFSHNFLDENLEESRKKDLTVITPFMKNVWKGFDQVSDDVMLKSLMTNVDR